MPIIFAWANMTIKTRHTGIEAVFRALSDRTRLRILQLLRAGELCVCDLVEVLDIPQPTTSRHLAYLRRTRLVEVRKEGQWVYYRLAAAASHFHDKVLECLACCEGALPQFEKDAERLKRCGRSNCCS